ncbi:MAG: (d)CMP kinase [Actinobacteria bacterium]|nr:(d)CMP kinase [Actinomycetota bacterium]
MRVVAIDGPAGAGKSTIARALARRLEIPYLDTGAMYRAVTHAALRDGVEPGDAEAVTHLATTAHIHVGYDTVTVDGVDVTHEIRSDRINQAVSRVAAISGVRMVLREQQRAWVSKHGGGVVEGRDIGTVVFPDATLKVFLTASAQVRARRRVAEYGGDVEAIARSISERDRLDSSRADSPLMTADGSITVDTSDLSIDEVVAKLHALVVEREATNG